LLPLAVGALWLAGAASALPTTYSMASGSQMSNENLACTPVPCTVPLAGSVTLDDDGAGNVVLTNVSLSHAPYEVGLLPFVSVMIDRDSITLRSGSVAGTGSTLTSVLFGPTSFTNVGTITCTSGTITCSSILGIPEGTFTLPARVNVDLGTWVFDGAGGLSASFVYNLLSAGGGPATETMVLVGTTAPVPESGTGLLVALGVLGLALRRSLSRRR
jgi:hypothetical protein